MSSTISSNDSSSISSINTSSTIKTENLLSCSYPFLFISNLIEFKVKQKKYSSDKIFEILEDYLEIDLKYLLDKINKNEFYKEKYDIILTTVFSCISVLSIQNINKNIIQNMINHLADEFEYIVNTYYAFNINKSFFDKHFNIYKLNDIKSASSSISNNNCDKQIIIESYLEESIKNINLDNNVNINNIMETIIQSSNSSDIKLSENNVSINSVEKIDNNYDSNDIIINKQQKNVMEKMEEKEKQNNSLEDIINNYDNNDLKSIFTEDINTEKNNGKSSSEDEILKSNNGNTESSKEKKKRGSYKKDGNQEKLINKIIKKLFNQKINNNLLLDIKNQNRNTIDLYVKICKEYENNEKHKYKDIILNYDKNISRYEIVNKIYKYIIKNKELYDSNIVFFYHTFDGLRSENVNNFNIALENKFTEWINNK